MNLKDPLQMLKGVGPKNAEILKSAGLVTVEDLIDYWPRRYDDYSKVSPIQSLKPGLVTVRGTFSGITARRSRRGLNMTNARLSDSSGSLHVVWFNQPYRAATIKVGEEYYVSGEFALKAGKLGITNPRIELASGITNEGGKILAIYRESKVLSSLLIRKVTSVMSPAFELLPENLPNWLLEEADLMPRSAAVKALHLPTSSKELKIARERLGFEEVFQMQLAGVLARKEILKEHSPVVEFDEATAKDFVAHLPFKLTADQKRTVWQIYKDMAQDTPMNRLVEGDVGSGKTIVAAMAAIMAMRAGYQVLFMAPTEILARQHANSLSKLLSHTEWADQIGLLVGSLAPKQKAALHARIASGECRLAVGTNALVQDKVITENVGLVIIDEQHRFGVEQRTKLRTKAGLFPHVLCMTATPIPRTLALTLYGELNITQLKTMPEGRTPIETDVILPSTKAALYKKIDAKIAEGRQAFIVCPLIEENAELGLTSVEGIYDTLRKGPFKHRSVGLLHGNMKADQKEQVMTEFKAGIIDLLVATTVIEVGVDVPNACVMVVESAERFGLAQIHQLRGRVGRGEHKGYCYLIPSDDQGISKRLRVLCYVSDGFRLSEIDLELRGPGAIYGMRQSGALDLRIAELTDEALISRAKKAAEEFVNRGEDVLKYPVLADRVQHFRSISKLN
jgi:ATP-dependent DNA helicase RecG